MQRMILAPMEGGECPPVPTMEASHMATHQHMSWIFPTRALCALVACWQSQDSSEANAPPPAGRFPLNSQGCVAFQGTMKAC